MIRVSVGADRRAGRVHGLALVVGLLPVLLAGQAAAPIHSASTSNIPDEAKALVVQVNTFVRSGVASPYGAGIIVAANGNALYIATANHVLQFGSITPTVWVVFASGDSAVATIVARGDSVIDLALLKVTANQVRLARWTPRSWDRVGNVHALRGDDPVSPVGCPNRVCWLAPSPADHVAWRDQFGIVFQSYFVDPGSSGGALFNQWWEVVGMVVRYAPPRPEALSIDQILRTVRSWQQAVSLESPSIPRAGYRTAIGLTLLGSSPWDRISALDRWPSGRLTVLRQATRALHWHLGAMRLAPPNLAITAGMAGLDIHLRRGRFALDPFVEAGFGHVEGRHDLGGYYIAGNSGNVYVPQWDRVVGDGIGVGGGATLEAVAFPHTILELTTGYWSFTMPLDAPKLKKLFIGVGVRLGL
jgi:trypsin-like peptidase